MSHNTSFISNSQKHYSENHSNPHNLHDNGSGSAFCEWGRVAGARSQDGGKEELQSPEPGAGCGENCNSETFGRDALLPLNLGHLFWCFPFSLSYMCCHIKESSGKMWKVEVQHSQQQESQECGRESRNYKKLEKL